MNSMLRKFSLLLLVFVGTFATAQTVNLFQQKAGVITLLGNIKDQS